MTRVVIADDQALVRSGFTMILTAAEIEVVGQAANGLEAVAAAPAAPRRRADGHPDARRWTAWRPPDGSSPRHQPPPMATRSGCSC